GSGGSSRPVPYLLTAAQRRLSLTKGVAGVVMLGPSENPFSRESRLSSGRTSGNSVAKGLTFFSQRSVIPSCKLFSVPVSNGVRPQRSAHKMKTDSRRQIAWQPHNSSLLSRHDHGAGAF